MKFILSLTLVLSITTLLFAQDEDILTDTSDISAVDDLLAYVQYADSVNNSFNFQKGEILLDDGLAKLTVPEGYKFLDEEQSHVVLEDLWGNPPADMMGLLFPDSIGPMSLNFTYAIEISYSKEGHIKDDDANDIDYDELLEQMQDEMIEANKFREEQGYSTVELVGWASDPFYDEESKKLHWAKELDFADSEDNTLNYNIRVLGRNGYLNLNVIGDMSVLPQVQSDIEPILGSVEFTEGNTYFDFDPDIDDVAAYGIGGLIAGKILAKAGFFAALLKFWKFILIGILAAFGALKNFFIRLFTGRNPENEKEVLPNKNHQ